MSKVDIEKFKQILSKSSYRVTKARIDTFNLLICEEPQSIAEIIRKSKGRVDRVSIYRNIDLFLKLGIANKLQHGWKYKLELSDEFVEHHHHMRCISCGKVFDIEDEKHIDEFINEVAEKFNFTPRSHIFEVEGSCFGCSI